MADKLLYSSPFATIRVIRGQNFHFPLPLCVPAALREGLKRRGAPEVWGISAIFPYPVKRSGSGKSCPGEALEQTIYRRKNHKS
jgi:hypothetical protein